MRLQESIYNLEHVLIKINKKSLVFMNAKEKVLGKIDFLDKEDLALAKAGVETIFRAIQENEEVIAVKNY